MKNKKMILLLAALTIMMTMTGCSSVSDVSSSLYNKLVEDDKDSDVPKISTDTNKQENYNTNVSVEGKYVYDSIVQYAKSQIPYETYFPDYSETNFPDLITLEPCNEKIKQGVYANYKAVHLTNIEYLYINNYGEEDYGTIVWPGIYCDCNGDQVTILAIELN
ncbi:MAG: hypothetical protein K2K09_06025 [Lachnospiraceae bacterium]|nr:hypothetical protein [Lachnospiraceae bacterium]